jgi:hypothetical protein
MLLLCMLRLLRLLRPLHAAPHAAAPPRTLPLKR